MARPSKGAIVLALTVLLALTTSRPAGGQVPTPADVAACNDQAPEAIRTGGGSPIAADHTRAERVRGRAGAAGAVVESSDPQIHGMEGEGAKDAAYQAAYRSCMRRKGF